MNELDFEKAASAAKTRQNDEEVSFRRAVMAGKARLSILLHEQEMLETFPREERGGVMAFVRWVEGRKFKGGVREKLVAKAAFVEGWKICEAVHEIGAFAPKAEK